MASVDPRDPLIDQEKEEDPDMKDSIETLKLLISILRPYVNLLSKWNIEDRELKVRVKHMDEVVQKVFQEVQPLIDSNPTDVVQGNEDWESSPTNVPVFFSILNVLRSLHDEMTEIEDLLSDDSSASISSENAEHLVCFIDSLLQNLKDVFICRADSIVPVKKVLEDAEDRLILFRYFLWPMPNRLIEQANMFLVFNDAQSLAFKISLLLYSVCLMNDELNDEWLSEMRDVFPDLIDAIDTSLIEGVSDICDEYLESLVAVPDDTPIMDEQVLAFADYLIHKLRLLSDNEGPISIVAPKDLTDSLINELNFLRFNLMDLLLRNPITEMKSLTITTQALIFETGLFIYMSLDAKEDDPKARYCSFKLPDLLKAVDNLKQQASDLFNKFFSESWQSNCPSTNVLEYVNFLINKLEELLHAKATPLNALKHQTEIVYEEIVSMRKLLCDVGELGNSQMEFLLTRYKDAAYQAEHVIDSFVAAEGSIWCHKLGLFVVMKDVKILQKEVKSLLTVSTVGDSVVPSLFSGASSLAHNPPNINVAVGSTEGIYYRVEEAANDLVVLKDAEEEIIELLTGGSRQLKLVSIVGMPGLGKTTLANSVYNHPSINLHFYVRAWCCVSQVYEKDTLLFDIFGQIVGKTIQSRETSPEDLVQKLYQSLKGRRYLIVIDDIWDIKAWNDLKGPFPDDGNGSRILFTAREQAVALEANSIPYALRLLSPEESCKLLLLKVFGGEICTPEWLTISERIARNCKGLPLAVVLMAGILKRTERKEDCWEHVSNTLISSEVSDILEFSYKHLPNCLKPCFIYFGTFPEDITVSASKLIRLWICEGFVQQPSLCQKSLEQEAENYLNDLVDRSLLMVDRRSSKGGVKACHVHDILRDFCTIKLRNERFLMQEHKYGGTFVLYGDLEKHICSLLFYYGLDRTINFRRNLFDFDFVLQYEFLGVLDLENVPFGSGANTTDFVNIAKLVQLRYLAIGVDTDNIPSEIGNLRNLETFLLTGASDEIMLPETIWNLVSLRHILTKNSFFSFQHYNQDFYQYFCQLDNLKSISAITLSHGDDIEKFILRRLTGIQKLGCKFSNSWDDSTGCNLFPVLNFLSELQSLKVFFLGKTLYPCKFSFPSNLKKLSLSNFRLPWDEISIIGQLPNLEVLKLLNNTFEGQQWDMREGEFENLKFLKLDSLNIELWNASSEHLPCLEKLVLISCQQLEEIPSSFGEIPTLQLIEMKWCSSSAMESVKQILEEQREMSNDQLNVTIVGVVKIHG
ncbi:hypothetical protein ACH5RR_034399 [Cinchona calisaya]|uniref:Late blight resistance protein homolog R1A-3 n=1 Tax=Cinchona calisaya TaxID=153742 RepID=A0ABD2YGA0_9GENT